MDVFPTATVEWAQEVILRAIKRKITEWQATEIIGISDGSIGRGRERYEEHGYDGLPPAGRPSGKRVRLWPGGAAPVIPFRPS